MPYTVLIVEDEFLLAKSLSTQLSSLGNKVIGIAENGKQAVDMALELKPQLILMDIKLPEIDGITAAQLILQKLSVPIIIISAFSESSFITGAVNAGVINYLVKPISINDLQTAIDLSFARYQDISLLRQQVEELKAAMETRKLVERAKGIIIKQTGISEHEAFCKMQKISQQQNRNMAEVARAIITAAPALSDGKD